MKKELLPGVVDTKMVFTETISKYEEILAQFEQKRMKAEELPWFVLQDRFYCQNLKLNEMIHAGHGRSPEFEQLVIAALKDTIQVYWDGIKMMVQPQH